MERCTRLAQWVVPIVLFVAFSSRLAAHDFWIEPSSFDVKVGDAVRIHLRVGEHFHGEPVVRNDSGIERFVLVGPAGEQPVIGREGMDPAGLLRLDAPGIWYVGYHSKPSSVELEAAAFEQYLKEEGLERIIEDRATRSESKAPGREQFYRSVKALLRAGTAGTPDGYDRLLGLPLEFKLEADPHLSVTGGLPLQLLRDGRALAGSLVVAYRKDAGARAKGLEAFRARTDSDGRVRLPVGAGRWLVKAVDMQRAAPGSGADWHSTWTAVTFEIPPAAR